MSLQVCYPHLYPFRFFFCFPGSRLDSLRAAARSRRRQAFRPATLRNHRSSHTLFLQFCSVFQVDREAPSIDDLGAFAEWMLDSGLACATVRNHMSSVKTLYIWWDKPGVVDIFSSDPWALTIRGIMNSVRPGPPATTAVAPEHLLAMLEVCAPFPQLSPFKLGFIFGFLGFFRVSNLAPPKSSKFDRTRHTTWADISTSPLGVVVSLKWTKSRQHALHPVSIPLPALGSSPLCPLQAWEEYVRALGSFTPSLDSPLLLSTGDNAGTIITIPQFRATFHRVAALAGLADCGYTPHSLRRGGASFSYKVGVKIPAIKTHGTWKSSAVDSYLLSQPLFQTPVVRAFIKFLSGSQ